MTSAVAVEAGSLWVVTAGDHKNVRNRVTGTTTNRVKYVVVGSGGDNWNGRKTKSHGEMSVPLAEWLTTRTPESGLTLPSTNGGASYRRVATPLPKRSEEPVRKTEPARGVINAPRGNISIETVTPDIAQSWIDRGGVNRKLVERRVAALAAAFKRGEGRLTYEPIVFDDEGHVINGQHRLHAIVRSGVPLQMMLVRGAEPEVFDVMDTGRSRTIGDILSIHGYASKDATAAAVRNLIFYEAYGTFNPGARESQTLINSVTTLEYLEKHPDVHEGLLIGDRIRGAGLQGGIGVWAALATLWLRSDPDKAKAFAESLITGAGLMPGDPGLALRNRCVNRTAGEFSKSGKGREFLGAIAIKAWNAYVKGQQVYQLVWKGDAKKPEPFPAVQ